MIFRKSDFEPIRGILKLPNVLQDIVYSYSVERLFCLTDCGYKNNRDKLFGATHITTEYEMKVGVNQSPDNFYELFMTSWFHSNEVISGFFVCTIDKLVSNHYAGFNQVYEITLDNVDTISYDKHILSIGTNTWRMYGYIVKYIRLNNLISLSNDDVYRVLIEHKLIDPNESKYKVNGMSTKELCN
jgi:hypothetical protein